MEPEAASVGLTEEQCRAQGIDYKVGKFPMSANGKALILNGGEGLVKIIAGKEYGEILGDRGADSLISPKSLSTYAIIRYVRAMENTGGSAVLTIHRIADGGAEALEFAVTDATEHLHERLVAIRLKPGILIVCINHMGKIIIPGGRDTLSAGDTVVIVTTAGREILDLNDIFA